MFVCIGMLCLCERLPYMYDCMEELEKLLDLLPGAKAVSSQGWVLGKKNSGFLEEH